MTVDDARALRRLGLLFMGVGLVFAILSLLLGPWGALPRWLISATLLSLGLVVGGVAQVKLSRARDDAGAGRDGDPGSARR